MISLALALASLGAQTAPAPAASTGWTIRHSTDPAKPKSATASVRSSDGNSRLVVRCDTANIPIVSVQFLPRPALQAGEPRIVTLTFDGAKADMTSWLFPGSGAYNGEPAEVFPLVSEIAAAKKITVALEDEGKALGGEFVGPGSDAILREVYTACGLPYAMPSATPPAPAPAKK